MLTDVSRRVFPDTAQSLTIIWHKFRHQLAKSGNVYCTLLSRKIFLWQYFEWKSGGDLWARVFTYRMFVAQKALVDCNSFHRSYRWSRTRILTAGHNRGGSRAQKLWRLLKTSIWTNLKREWQVPSRRRAVPESGHENGRREAINEYWRKCNRTALVKTAMTWRFCADDQRTQMFGNSGHSQCCYRRLHKRMAVVSQLLN